MKLRKLIQCCLVCVISTVATPADAQTTRNGLPPLHVDGKFLKDEQGNKVVLHGLMDTPSMWFNGDWINGRQTPFWQGGYNDTGAQNCLNYFSAIFDAIANSQKGTNCKLFRLHLDPAWTNNNAASWPVDDREKGTNEADFSHYDGNRLNKYLTNLYLPIAQRAIKHGMYVIMRPPGVCPGDIYVGGSYQKYLLDVWDKVSKNLVVQRYCGQISLELANEPVSVKLANGQNSKQALHDFFQPIVDKIRANGFKGIIWVPGSGWQASYADYAEYPITGENIGYAVHDYNGWYGCDDKNLSTKDVSNAIQRKIQQFHNQVPVVDTNPIVITEIDWSPFKPGTGHTNEHGDWVESNFGTWATGRSSVWGAITKGVYDHYGNVSMTLSGSHCYIDIRGSINMSNNGTTFSAKETIIPAFKKDMEQGGLDPFDGCGVACFQWYADYAKVNYASETRYQPLQEYPENPFEFSQTWFNPSIIKQSTATHVRAGASATSILNLKKNGLSGWSFEDGIDLSGYQKMVVTLVRTPGKNTFIRIYDSGSLFGDYWQFDLGGLKEKEIDLHDIKKASGEPIDPSHIRFVGFSADSDVTLYVKDVQLVKEDTAIEDIPSDAADEEEYYLDLMGRPVTNPTHGIYIVNGKKVFIP